MADGAVVLAFLLFNQLTAAQIRTAINAIQRSELRNIMSMPGQLQPYPHIIIDPSFRVTVGQAHRLSFSISKV
jgi:hypothetical protein